MLVLSSRGVVQSMNWVRDNADDPEIQVDAEKAKKAFCGPRAHGQSASASSAWATWAQGRQRLRRPEHGRLRLRPVHFR